jgi:hypothetical protein
VARSSDPAIARILTAMESWRPRFEAARVHFIVGLGQPKLEPGERYAGRVFQVGVHDVDPGAPMSAWGLKPGTSWGAPDGAVCATDRRVFLLGFRNRIRREWRWDGLASVALIPGAFGVALRPGVEATTMTVLASQWNRFTLSRPVPSKLIVRWLKVEAAFAASQGRLDQWFSELSERLERGFLGPNQAADLIRAGVDIRPGDAAP